MTAYFAPIGSPGRTMTATERPVVEQVAASMADPETPPRHVLGAVVEAARHARGLTVESACAGTSVSHMTWRRVERGVLVRSQGYDAVDVVFELPHGATAAAACGGSDQLHRYATQLNVDLDRAVEQAQDKRARRSEVSKRPATKRRAPSAAAELRRWAAIYGERVNYYPPDLFPPDSLSAEAIAARMARHVYALVARELNAAAEEAR